MLVPGCLPLALTVNACQGACESYALPSSWATLHLNPRHLLTSVAQCCNIMETKNVSSPHREPGAGSREPGAGISGAGGRTEVMCGQCPMHVITQRLNSAVGVKRHVYVNWVGALRPWQFRW